MANFHLPSTLRHLAGGAEQVEVPGATVGEALRQLERTHPRLAGWVLDERGRLRPHVSLFRNDERAAPESPLAAGDQVHIVPAISGGTAIPPGEVEVLLGTRKGLLVLRGPRGGRLAVTARRFAGQPVEYALRDPRSRVS
jgi:molybdopterin synthase sulfur carrier subunit